ncbi:aminotransferase class I/II-fold pyridoxal phosphate-dependent enzyme [Candidatus Pelagibacter sp.]|nr:aminotransferase class I/II-fold pyridoxal phosphate-dependent enzyme [Candidatus Pelagibacter sp.]
MFNDLDLYNNSSKKKIIQSIKKAIDENNFIFGKNISKLENKLSKFTKSKYVITVGSGTDALLISLMSLNLKEGDEIILPSFSWLSVIEVVLLLKLKPIFVDTDIYEFNLDVNKVKKLINKNTKAVISTSLFGRTCNLNILKKILPKRICLIEDGAQNLGSIYNKKSSLNIADISCTSFFPTKNLGSFGDGGAIFTNNKKKYDQIIMIRNHGQKKYSYTSQQLGLNSRLGTIQASILIEKLRKIKFKLNKQIKLYQKYQIFFTKYSIIGFPKLRNTSLIKDSCSAFNITVKKRKILIKDLIKNKIPFKIYYPKPLYKQYNLKKKIKLKNTEFLCKSIISLPFNDFSKKRFNNIIQKLAKIIKNNKTIFFEKKT